MKMMDYLSKGEVCLVTLWAIFSLVAFIVGSSSNLYGLVQLLHRNKWVRQHLLLVTLLLVGLFVCGVHVPTHVVWVSMALTSNGTSETGHLAHWLEGMWYVSEAVFYLSTAFLAIHRHKVITSSLATISVNCCGKNFFVIVGMVTAWSIGLLVLCLQVASCYSAGLDMIIENFSILVFFISMLAILVTYAKVLWYVYKTNRNMLTDQARYRLNYHRFFEMTKPTGSSSIPRRSLRRTRASFTSDLLNIPDVMISRSASQISQSHLGSALAPALVGVALDPLNLMLSQTNQTVAATHASRSTFSRRRSSLDVSRVMSMRRALPPSPIPEATFALPGCVRDEEEKCEPEISGEPSNLDQALHTGISCFSKEEQIQYYLQKLSSCKRPTQDLTFQKWVDQAQSRGRLSSSNASEEQKLKNVVADRHRLKIPKWNGPRTSVLSKHSSSMSTASTLTIPSSSHESRIRNASSQFFSERFSSDRSHSTSTFVRSFSTQSLPDDFKPNFDLGVDILTDKKASQRSPRKSLGHLMHSRVAPAPRKLPRRHRSQREPTMCPVPVCEEAMEGQSLVDYKMPLRKKTPKEGVQVRDRVEYIRDCRVSDEETLSIVSMANSSVSKKSCPTHIFQENRQKSRGKGKKHRPKGKQSKRKRKKAERPTVSNLPALRHEKGIQDKEMLSFLDSPTKPRCSTLKAWSDSPTKENNKVHQEDVEMMDIAQVVCEEMVVKGSSVETVLDCQQMLYHRNTLRQDDDLAQSVDCISENALTAEGQEQQVQLDCIDKVSSPVSNVACKGSLSSGPTTGRTTHGSMTKQSICNSNGANPTEVPSRRSGQPMRSVSEQVSNRRGSLQCPQGTPLNVSSLTQQQQKNTKFKVTLRKTLLLICHFIAFFLPFASVRLHHYWTSQVNVPSSQEKHLWIWITQSFATLAFATFPFVYIFNNKSLMKRKK